MVFDDLISVPGIPSHLNYQAGYTKGYTNGFKVRPFCAAAPACVHACGGHAVCACPQLHAALGARAVLSGVAHTPRRADVCRLQGGLRCGHPVGEAALCCHDGPPGGSGASRDGQLRASGPPHAAHDHGRGARCVQHDHAVRPSAAPTAEWPPARVLRMARSPPRRTARLVRLAGAGIASPCSSDA